MVERVLGASDLHRRSAQDRRKPLRRGINWPATGREDVGECALRRCRPNAHRLPRVETSWLGATVLDPATLIRSENRSSSVICSSTLRARTSAGASCVASRVIRAYWVATGGPTFIALKAAACARSGTRGDRGAPASCCRTPLPSSDAFCPASHLLHGPSTKHGSNLEHPAAAEVRSAGA
jgi:hypothetical protein